MLASQTDYATALTLIDMYYSPACRRTKSIAEKEHKKLITKTAKLNAIKEQIRIRVKGFGWSDLTIHGQKEAKITPLIFC